MATGPARAEVSAWRPAVPGIAEVFHAHFTDHAYPSHTHEVWTLLIVDDGAIRFDLDRHEHGAVRPTVTLLPPHVPHDGRSATDHGFRKRVLYLDTTVLGAELAGAAVDRPSLPGPRLRQRIHQLHGALADPADAFEAECRLAFIRDHLAALLRRRPAPTPQPAADLAGRLRELLDARTPERVTLAEAAAVLHAHPAHLVRAFTERHGLPPHRYLTGRRIELARRLLLAGQPPAQVAAAAGFCDQSHLTRTFRRHLGVSPGRYARRGAYDDHVSHIDARPVLFVISGPSGSGKGTAMRWVTTHGGLNRVTTYTTRTPRETETDGLDYHFVEEAQFHRLHDDGTIFEYTRTYSESLYGSPTVLLDSTDPRPLVVELDPAGFVRIRAASHRRVVGIFITTVSEAELRKRIQERGQGGQLHQRLRIRVDQLTWAWSYDYVLLNDDLAEFQADLGTVVRAELLRTSGARRLLELRKEIDLTLQPAAT